MSKLKNFYRYVQVKFLLWRLKHALKKWEYQERIERNTKEILHDLEMSELENYCD